MIPNVASVFPTKTAKKMATIFSKKSSFGAMRCDLSLEMQVISSIAAESTQKSLKTRRRSYAQ